MKQEFTLKTQNIKVEELYKETRQWKSGLFFIQDEIIFIDRLLNSYVFEPNTPNLFERLQNYRHRLQKIKSNKARIEKLIGKHENNMGGMLECIDKLCDEQYYKKHHKLKAEVANCRETFHELKSDIFNYAGGVLKKRKQLP